MIHATNQSVSENEVSLWKHSQLLLWAEGTAGKLLKQLKNGKYSLNSLQLSGCDPQELGVEQSHLPQPHCFCPQHPLPSEAQVNPFPQALQSSDKSTASLEALLGEVTCGFWYPKIIAALPSGRHLWQPGWVSNSQGTWALCFWGWTSSELFQLLRAGMSLSLGVVFLLSRLSQQSLVRQLPVPPSSRWNRQQCSSGLWVCAVESIPAVIWA